MAKYYAFQLTRMIVFEISFNNYFSTQAARFNQPKTDYIHCGQAQKTLCTGKAKEFYEKFDKFHLHYTNQLSEKDKSDILEGIESLKKVYNYLESERDISFYDLKNLSMQKVKLSKV